MNTYASVALIKVILNITGTSKDIALRQLAKAQKANLDAILGVTGLEYRTITDERQKRYGTELFFYVNEFNPGTPTGFKDLDDNAILADEIAYMEAQGGYSRKIHLRYPIGYDEFKVTYPAGYVLDTTIEVDDYTALTGKYIQVGETVLNEGTDFDAETSNATTATNIKTALTTAGYTSTVAGAVVTLGIPDDISTDSVDAITVTATDLPYNIRVAFAYLVGGALAEREGIGNLASYTLGAKTVSFRTGEEKTEFERIIKNYAGQFKKSTIVS